MVSIAQEVSRALRERPARSRASRCGQLNSSMIVAEIVGQPGEQERRLARRLVGPGRLGQPQAAESGWDK
ncbi:MAG: hypothetical protein ACRDJK_12785 [Actinomycetota bacterium]